MTKILKRARVNYSYKYSFFGETTVEIQIDDNGKGMFIAVSDEDGEGIYYVSKRSIFEELIAKEGPKYNLPGVIEEYETGAIEDFEIEEKEMSKSKFYKCFLYLNKLVMNDTVPEKVVEYSDDYGKDIDQMKLKSLKKSYELEKMMRIGNTLVIDEKGNVKYAVLSAKCDADATGWVDAYNAEAIIEINGERKYLEASWISEADWEMEFEINDKSVHDILINGGDPDELDKIRETGRIYDRYEDAMNTEYSDTFAKLALLISKKLIERNYFNEMDEEDEDFELPKWYKLSKDQSR